MQTVILTPEDVSATYRAGTLTIEASGHEDGVTDIAIVSADAEPVTPPPFRVQGQQSPAVGHFPYQVEATFPVDGDPQEIAIESPNGTLMVSVRSLTSR
ncbi:hypothetical protein GCM10010124_29820 [Pilimelia terevasa]|uniref:Uncharacterized protein n=1 Tax=Pilimelia terevasa TaxID=53372 RepID=A0A8J3BSU4_9ACTN|nr:hypothetical protein [Pilimelia terevasa]GGK35173.1 hypothetical protein GCM10010124_29820 [Pilimelia terevasa]